MPLPPPRVSTGGPVGPAGSDGGPDQLLGGAFTHTFEHAEARLDLVLVQASDQVVVNQAFQRLRPAADVDQNYIRPHPLQAVQKIGNVADVLMLDDDPEGQRR